MCHPRARADYLHATMEDEFDPVKRPTTEDDNDDIDYTHCEYLVEYTDEFYCDYDSTWEMSRRHPQWAIRPRTFNPHKINALNAFKNASRDMQKYRRNYPGKVRKYQWKLAMPSLDFYLGKASSPDGVFIDEYHSKWFRDYRKLESGDSFMRWLFPIQEPGVRESYENRELTKEEIEAFLEDDTAKHNLLKSYKLVLDLFGIEMVNEGTGELQRSPAWKERFAYVDGHDRSDQHVTRILKCLGTLGFSHYQAPLVRFFLKETLVLEELKSLKDAVLNYFVFTVLDKRRRRNLLKYAYHNYQPRGLFVWCPRKIQLAWNVLFSLWNNG